MEMNPRGQAAVTDALYFLMIVTFLSIFLFGFGNTYGNSIRSQVNDEADTAFATNSLKSILYSSTPRDPKQSIDDPDAEIDSLLALIKEDYADDEEIGADEREVLARAISSIMSPVQDTKDYMFAITIPPESGKASKYIFIFLHTTNFKREQAFTKDGRPLPGSFARYSADPDKPHIDYFCGINSGPGGQEFEKIQAKIRMLLANVGPTSQASASIKIVRHNNLTLEKYNGQADLILWDATWLGSTDDVQSGLLYGNDPKITDIEWACSAEASTTKAAVAPP